MHDALTITLFLGSLALLVYGGVHATRTWHYLEFIRRAKRNERRLRGEVAQRVGPQRVQLPQKQSVDARAASSHEVN